MNITKNHVIGALAVVAVFNEIAADWNRHVIKKQNFKIARLANTANYLCEMLDQNDVPITEFDRIAVNHLYENV